MSWFFMVCLRLTLLAVTSGWALMACGPAVIAVSPDTVAPGDAIEIYGTGLSTTVTARLQGGTSIQLQVTASTSSTVQARVPGAAPAGVYDVVVTSDGVDAVLAGGLTVVAGRVNVRFLDVGQGDATLITGPDGQSLLIDGGPASASTVVIQAVDDVGGVDHVALTHTDADHLAGLTALLSGDDGGAGTDDDSVPRTRWIGHDDAVCTSQLCNRFRALRARFERPLVGDTLDLGGATVEVVGRDGDFGVAGAVDVDDENERSLALLLRFGGRTVFVAGDLTGGGLGSSDVEAAAARATGPVDVLRLNHHGSATSSSAAFLAALQPAAVIVSAGTDNPFCHPERGVVDRLRDAGPAVFSTGRGIVSDGARCDGATDWPAGSHVGVGTIELVIEEDGRLSVDGEAF